MNANSTKNVLTHHDATRLQHDLQAISMADMIHQVAIRCASWFSTTITVVIDDVDAQDPHMQRVIQLVHWFRKNNQSNDTIRVASASTMACIASQNTPLIIYSHRNLLPDVGSSVIWFSQQKSPPPSSSDHVFPHACYGLAAPQFSSCACLLPIDAIIRSDASIATTPWQLLLRPWHSMTQEHTGSSFVMEVVQQSMNPMKPSACLLHQSTASWPFQLLLMLVRWSYGHPLIMQLVRRPLTRKCALLAQKHTQEATKRLMRAYQTMHHGEMAVEWSEIKSSRTISMDLDAMTAWCHTHIAVHDHYRRLSCCRLWEQQKHFYLSLGIQAWSDHYVPFGVSSSSFLAASYAHQAIAFLLDVATRSHTQTASDQPNCFIWEAASGSCKFLHAFLQHFFHLVEAYELVRYGMVPCVIASDLSPQVVHSRMDMACFQPFLMQRQLEFAVFDTATFRQETDQSLYLQYSKRFWRPGSNGPVVLMGNYFVDSLKTDVFLTTASEVYEVVVDPLTPSISSMDCRLRVCDASSRYYANDRLQQTMETILSQERTSPSMVLFPVEALEILDAIQTQMTKAQQPLALMVGDATFSFRDRLPLGSEELELPQLSPHPDCFCVPVDLEILQLFLQTHSGSNATMYRAVASETFNVVVATTFPPAASGSKVSQSKELASFTPSDCDLLYGMLGTEHQAPFLSFALQLQVLAQTAWDWDLFVAIQWSLLRQSKPTDAHNRQLLVDAGKRSYQTFYELEAPQSGGRSLGRVQLARWFYVLGAYPEVLLVLEQEAVSTPVVFLQALSWYHLHSYWKALAFFRQCMLAQPKKLKFRKYVAMTLRRLQAQS